MTYNRPNDVYWIFDSEDRLLYIGMGRSAIERVSTHEALRCQSAVSNELCHRAVRIEYRTFNTPAEAHAVERYAIETEAPYLNRQHNPKRFRKVQRGGYVPVGSLPLLPPWIDEERKRGYTPNLLSRLTVGMRGAA